MRRVSYQQFAIVQGDSAQQLTDRLNRRLYELRDKEPTVTFEGLIARISYTEEDVIETETDIYNSNQIKLKCKDCPMFEPIRKKDGTADRRTTIGYCPYAQDGVTYTTANACGEFFDSFRRGDFKLCFKEE